MTATIKNNTLHLEVPMQAPTPSKASGKTFVVASSHGNQTTAATLEDGRQVVVSLNAFVYPPRV